MLWKLFSSQMNLNFEYNNQKKEMNILWAFHLIDRYLNVIHPTLLGIPYHIVYRYCR